ncbi:pectinesterase family protein [Catenulispora subtropica]|uniref:Pectinesterase family protein n=1 Tax=Catenulispora subtropica TaxID=450798 RepID=A0ABN2QSY8_9ACTN
MTRADDKGMAASFIKGLAVAVAALAVTATASTSATADTRSAAAGQHQQVFLVAPTGTPGPRGVVTFTSIQAAVNAAAPGTNGHHTLIKIAPGTYTGQVYIPADKPNLTFTGLGDASQIVLKDNLAHGTIAADGNLYGTDCSATLTVAGNGFEAYNITVANAFDRAADPATAARGPQAVAVKAVADKAIFAHDRFLGVQDTVFASSYADDFAPNQCFAEDGTPTPPAKSGPAPANPPAARQYFVDDYIAGSIDFVCGSATAVFERDTIDILRGRPGGSVSAPDTPTAFSRGYLIDNSRIDNLDGSLAAGADYLSRPWRHTGTTNPVAQMTIRNTYLGAAISPAHYENWSSPFFKWTDARYSEYRNIGPAAADVAADVPQLTSQQAASYTVAAYFGDWTPVVSG